jgi:hypothetical protein
MANTKPEVLKTLTSERTLQKVNQGKRRTLVIPLDFSEIDEKFVGKYQVHHPSQMERLQVGVIKSQLLGGIVPLDTMTDNIATIIATLDVVTDEKPDWFDVYDDEFDYDIMEAVFMEYMEWVNSFRKGTGKDTDKGTSENKQG